MHRAEKILKDNLDLLHNLSKELLERESLDSTEIDTIISGGELPSYEKEGGNNGGGKSNEVPEHVKKLMEKRNKESAPKDDSN